MDNKKKKNKIIILIALLIVLSLIIGIAGILYAKYIKSTNGTSTADVAKMICYMEVESSEATKTNINPYCDVTVKDYNQISDNSQEITETDVEYIITVTAKQDENGNPFQLPNYYWQDSSGNIIAQSVPVSGKFKHGQAADHNYRIVFRNDGERDIKKYVELRLNAIQASESNN